MSLLLVKVAVKFAASLVTVWWSGFGLRVGVELGAALAVRLSLLLGRYFLAVGGDGIGIAGSSSRQRPI